MFETVLCVREERARGREGERGIEREKEIEREGKRVKRAEEKAEKDRTSKFRWSEGSPSSEIYSVLHQEIQTRHPFSDKTLRTSQRCDRSLVLT